MNYFLEIGVGERLTLSRGGIMCELNLNQSVGRARRRKRIKRIAWTVFFLTFTLTMAKLSLDQYYIWEMDRYQKNIKMYERIFPEPRPLPKRWV